MTSHLTGLKNAFSSQGVKLEIRIGETGWPTQGSQKDQPNAFLANVTNAQWYYQAMVDWANSNGVKTVMFAAYDEPWKGPADGSNSEAFFGDMEGQRKRQRSRTLHDERRDAEVQHWVRGVCRRACATAQPTLSFLARHQFLPQVFDVVVGHAGDVVAHHARQRFAPGFLAVT
jgi:glycosyl hydrolase family 17